MDHNVFLGKSTWGENKNKRDWFLDKIVSKLSHLKNIILISPHGWGKLSLVRKAGTRITEQFYNARTCYIDLQDVDTIEAFLDLFKAHLTAIGAPALKADENNDGHILNLPEFLAVREQLKIIIFIGNIQQIAKFKNTVQFQKKLRSRWNQQYHCAYCLYGNDQQMLRHLLDRPYAPLRAFCQVFNLPRINSQDWARFIQKGFQQSGKQISENSAIYISLKTNRIPHYVQLLAHHSLLRTTTLCTHLIVDEAVAELMLHFRPQYQILADTLTENQLSFLRMVLNCEHRICSREILAKYNLKTSSHITRLRESLINRSIIKTERTETFLLDPIFGYWLEKYYFRPYVTISDSGFRFSE